MSDGGGGESSKESEPCVKRRRKNDEFAQAIARIAVAQVCESVGFQGFQQSALDTFADVACKYVQEIGKVSSFYANLAGRTECNAFDVVQGLEDLNLSQGFVGASDRDNCLSGSGIVKDLSQFVNLSEEIAFAYSVPSFPVFKERKSTPSFLQAGETPPTDDIPPWLPVFVNPKTEETQTMPDRVEQEQKVLDAPSSKLDQFRAGNESALAGEHEDNARREEASNPFLVAPLPPGEKEVSSILLPTKLKEEDTMQNHGNHVSELDQSAPKNQVKSSGVDTGEGSRMAVLKDRPLVRMKLNIGKTSLSTVIRPNDKGKEKVTAWFTNDDVRDEEEKRTEKLSKVPMDIEEHTGNDSVVN